MDFRRLLRRNGKAQTPAFGFWQVGSLDGAVDPAIPSLPLLSPPAAPGASTPTELGFVNPRLTTSLAALKAAGRIAWAPQPIASGGGGGGGPLVRTSHAVNDSGNGGGSGYGTGTYTTPAFTSNSSSLLVVAIKGVDQGLNNNSIEAAMTVSDSNGGTWSKRIGAHSLTSDNDFVIWWTSPVTTGASTTITVGSGGTHNVYRYIVEIYSYTGYDTTTPVGGTVGTGNAAGSTPYTQSLSATPDASSHILAGCISDGGTSSETVGTGWTALYSGAPDIKYLTETITGHTSTTVTWNALTNVSSSGVSSAALEIRESPGGGGTATPSQLAFHRPFNLSRLAAPIISGAIAWAPQPISAPATQTPSDLDFVQPFNTSQLPAVRAAPQPAWTPQPFSAPAFRWSVRAQPVTAPKIAAAGPIAWTPQASFSLVATPDDLGWQSSIAPIQAAKLVPAGPINWSPRPFDALPFGWFKSSGLPSKPDKPNPAGAVSWATQALSTAAVTPAPLEWYRQFNTARAPQAVGAPQVSWIPAVILPLAATPGPLEWLQPAKPQGLAGLVAAPAVRWTPQGFTDPAFGWYVPTTTRGTLPGLRSPGQSPAFVTPPVTPAVAPSFGWFNPVAPQQQAKPREAAKHAWAPQPLVVTVTLPPIGWLRQTPIVQLPQIRSAGPVKYVPLPIINPVSMIYVYNGTAFVQKPVKVWDGFAW